jgi:hypothetical protein
MRGYYEVRPVEWRTRCFGQAENLEHANRGVLISQPYGLEQFRNYCGLIKIARCGFPWEKTTKRPIASAYTHCETALAVSQ